MATNTFDVLNILKKEHDALRDDTDSGRAARYSLSNVMLELKKRFEDGYFGDLYRTDYIVEGSDEFPFDMLRYTQSWPTLESEITLIEQPLDGYPKRRVRLSKYHRDPRPQLAENRWSSKFHWKVVEVVETVQI